ncbi:MAG: DNA-directed RNA polymerase subunit alpha C-terminal domain-containing protein [Planctomycetaceae bacterium]
MPRIPYKNLMLTDEMAEKLGMSTAEIGLSVRTTNCLEERGIFTVNDLLNCTRSDLLSISNFGEKTLEEVYRSLERIGFFRATAGTSDQESVRIGGIADHPEEAAAVDQSPSRRDPLSGTPGHRPFASA